MKQLKLSIVINTENAAFQDDNLYLEIERILQSAIKKIEFQSFPITLQDVNGNTCGKIEAKIK